MILEIIKNSFLIRVFLPTGTNEFLTKKCFWQILKKKKSYGGVLEKKYFFDTIQLP